MASGRSSSRFIKSAYFRASTASTVSHSHSASLLSQSRFLYASAASVNGGNSFSLQPRKFNRIADSNVGPNKFLLLGNTFSRNFYSSAESYDQMNQTEFTYKAWRGIKDAENAARHNKQQVESEHLMKALLEQKDGLARRILTKAGLDNTSVLQATDEFISQQPKDLFWHVRGYRRPAIGAHLITLLQNARMHEKDMKDEFVSVEHFILAFYSDKRFGQQLFRKFQLSEEVLKDAIHAVRGHQRVTDLKPEEMYETLDIYGNDLTELARQGKLSPVIGRDDEIRMCIRILSRMTNNNPVIIGERGVGKTAIAEGLAQWIVRGDVPEPLMNRKLISLDKYRGDFEESLEDVLTVVASSNGQIILFIDEIHTVVGAGASSGATDAGNLLKSMLGRGELRCIGATTSNEYRKYIEKDPELERRFQQVLCDQPSVEDSISILRGMHQRFELHHGVKISDSAFVSAAFLSDRYNSVHFLPEKAINLVDEAAAMVKVKISCKPIELSEIDRAILKLELEGQCLKNDSVKASPERLSKLEHDLDSFKLKQKELQEQWNQEKSLMNRIISIKDEIDRVKLELEAPEHEHDLNRAAELKYETLISLQRQLHEAEKNLAEFQKSGKPMLQKGVTELDIAEVVSKWTGIPLSNLQQSDTEKLAA